MDYIYAPLYFSTNVGFYHPLPQREINKFPFYQGNNAIICKYHLKSCYECMHKHVGRN